ncbi:putative esterase Atu5261 [Colletotrichum liriopes]|uniref:Carboxylic ester hydrolase n=1 Tax=Colletotrichum liriopes TaxID=708192 RepID=A0AA37LXT9_9PEZI|nr:putative esterase Atu5261 [Colletotrichum liriopes]
MASPSLRSLLVLGLGLSITSPAVAVPAFNYSSIAGHCNDLYDFTGDGGFEAPTKVVAVQAVPANSTTGVPAYCSVTAKIDSLDGITTAVLYLPSEGEDWNGIVSGHGCGGSCGATGLDYVYGYGVSPVLGYGKEFLSQGYVIYNNDMGHNNTETKDTLSSWNAFRNNRTNELNFAFLSTHLTTVSAKAIAEFYYGVPAWRSLFRGGSSGGRQGLVAAARYPHDYDGIVAAYGALNETAIGCVQYPYLAQVSRYPNGTQILSMADLYALNAGAIAACDANDGVVDDLIDLSYHCDWDPITILCASNTAVGATGGSGCLENMDKVTAARAMYGFPSNSFSDQLIVGRYTPGSELSWSMWTTEAGANFATSFCQNAAFQEDLPLSWSLNDYRWDADPYLLGPMEDLYTADFNGLKVYRDKGGKILHYQGWADASVSPGFNIELYQSTIDEIGLDATKNFHRLFVYPGMAHIDIHSNVNGTIGWQADYLGMINDWLDSGVAPDRILVKHWNMTTGAILNTRPYFAYPQTPKYIGGTNADLNNPENWVGVIPDKIVRGRDYPWKT